jgi:hypothetical protein
MQEPSWCERTGHCFCLALRYSVVAILLQALLFLLQALLFLLQAFLLRAILVLHAGPNKAARNPLCRASSASHSNQAEDNLPQIQGFVNRKTRP